MDLLSSGPFGTVLLLLLIVAGVACNANGQILIDEEQTAALEVQGWNYKSFVSVVVSACC